MSKTSALIDRLSELEDEVWLPPDDHIRRDEAYTKVKQQILAELESDPTDTLLKALLAETALWLDDSDGAEALAQSILNTTEAPGSARAIALVF